MKIKSFITLAVAIMMAMMAAGMANALEPVPKESGFNGFIRPGVGYMQYKTNMVASFLGFDLSDEQGSPLDSSPDSESSAIVLAPFFLGYTFAGSRTQIFLGTDLTDLVRFNYSQQLGVKQEIGKFGLIQGGFLFSGIPVEVWEDPYVAPPRTRSETDRDSMGARLAWDRIFGFPLQLQYTYRDIDIGNEKSGEFLGLVSFKRDLLDRNGDYHSGEILYRFDFFQRHRLTPAFILTRYDLDGDAMANDTWDIQLTYGYRGDSFRITANGFYGESEYDDENPIYNQDQDDDRYGLQATVYYKNPWNWRLFGSHPMNFYVGGAYVEIDSNISFYDQQAIMATGGIMLVW